MKQIAQWRPARLLPIVVATLVGGVIGTGIDHEVIRAMAIDMHGNHQVTRGVGRRVDGRRVRLRRGGDGRSRAAVRRRRRLRFRQDRRHGKRGRAVFHESPSRQFLRCCHGLPQRRDMTTSLRPRRPQVLGPG